MANTELILSIDIKGITGKFVFSIFVGYKNWYYTDENCVFAWVKLKKKFDPAFTPSLVRTEKTFSLSKLYKEEDPTIWMTNFEGICLKLEDMESHTTESQFMFQVLNSMTNDKETPLRID
jgi:hypothetical protein